MGTLDNRHTLALPHWARPGLVSFAKKASGGGKDDDEQDDEDDADADDDEDDDDDLGELSEDELRTELKKTRDSLSKASGSSKAKRDKIKKLTAELDEARKPKPTKKGDDDDDKIDVESVRDEAKREARKEADARTKKTVARAELKLAGVPAERVAKAVGLLALDDLDVTDDGEVDGLEDALDELKAEWPELFPKARKRRESVSGDTDNGSGGGRRELSASERQAKVALKR